MCGRPPSAPSSSAGGGCGSRRRNAASAIVATTLIAAAILLTTAPTPSFANDSAPPPAPPLEPPEDLVRLVESLEEGGGGGGGGGLNASGWDAGAERGLRDAASAVRSKHAELINRTAELNRAVREHNRLQLTDVLAGRLRDLLRSENRVREENSLYRMEGQRRRREAEEEEAARRKEEARTRVKRADLSKVFAPSDEHFMVASESRLEEFVTNVAVDQIAQNHQVADEEEDVSHLAEEADRCVTNEGASTMVVSAIQSYRGNATNRFDLAVASSGASIVYAHDMTSETYAQPASHDDHLLSKFSRWLGLRGPARPAENILSPSANLGSCWPMRGRSGRVTIRLGRPARVSSVSLRHASPSIEPPREGGPSSFPWGDDVASSGGGSAPRFFRLVGYPGCRGVESTDADDGGGCRVLGFDVGSPIELGRFEYKTVPQTTQTFYISDHEEQGREEGEEKEEEEAPEENDPFEEPPANGCSWSSCGTGSEDGGGVDATMKSDAELHALTLFVDDNWGNEDYTCLYHLGVHGDILVDES